MGLELRDLFYSVCCPFRVPQAHNGSGKTTCFVLGMLSRVDPRLKTPQALCVCPTRELAQQVSTPVALPHLAHANHHLKYEVITSID